MRMTKMRHPGLGDVQIDVAASAVRHHERAGWVAVDGESTVKTHPANTPSQDPADVRGVVGVEAPTDPVEGNKSSNGGRRPRTEGTV